MIKLTNLTNYPYQSMTLAGNSGQKIKFTLKYQPSQQLWYYNVRYLSFSLNQSTLVVSPNLLYQFSKNIPFGIACSSTDGWDPYYLNDFALGRISIYLLSEAEKNTVYGLINE